MTSIRSWSNGDVKQMRSIKRSRRTAVGEDEANVMRQALAGMLWSKQYFLFDVDKWIDEHGGAAPQS